MRPYTVDSPVHPKTSGMNEQYRNLYSLVAGMDYSKPVRRLQLTLSSGYVVLESYHHVGDFRWNPDGSSFSFKMRGATYYGTGEQLHRLIPYLRNDSLHHLYCYNPAYHTPDPSSPLLYTLTELL